MSAQRAAPAGSAGTDLEQYQSAGFCKHCWHVLTEGNEGAQKFPLAWTWNNLLVWRPAWKRRSWSLIGCAAAREKTSSAAQARCVSSKSCEWQPVSLLETQNPVFCVNYIYIFAIHLITVPVKACSWIWRYSTTLSWWKGSAPSTSALNSSRQGDKLLQNIKTTTD